MSGIKNAATKEMRMIGHCAHQCHHRICELNLTTGTARLAQAMVARGFYISASGIATFKKAEPIRAALKDVPLDRLLVETDAPYLAPQPHRGKPNEPAFVVHTAATLAELKGVSFDALADATTENFFRLFSKARKANV